ncbi:hypothetical protein ACMFDM_25975 (plasmid) [Escherichia coli]
MSDGSWVEVKQQGPTGGQVKGTDGLYTGVTGKAVAMFA